MSQALLSMQHSPPLQHLSLEVGPLLDIVGPFKAGFPDRSWLGNLDKEACGRHEACRCYPTRVWRFTSMLKRMGEQLLASPFTQLSPRTDSSGWKYSRKGTLSGVHKLPTRSNKLTHEGSATHQRQHTVRQRRPSGAPVVVSTERGRHLCSPEPGPRPVLSLLCVSP